MIDFFSKWYATIQNNNTFLEKYRIYSVHRVFVRVLANILLSIYFRCTSRNSQYKLIENKKNDGRIIVSLTSFPARINKVWMVVESMLRQTHKPDMIILWLSNEQFSSLNVLPKNLLDLQSRGLRIELKDEDLRSHKKYYYAMKEYPDDFIITIDDDIFYRKNMISNLIKYSEKFPNAIIAQYTRRVVKYKQVLSSYSKWSDVYGEDTICNNLFFGSGGGTLFPTNSLYKDCLKTELFMNLSSLADDLWLNAMARLNKRRVIKTNASPLILPIINKNNTTLSSVNRDQNMNDVQIENIRNYYKKELGIDPFKYKE